MLSAWYVVLGACCFLSVPAYAIVGGWFDGVFLIFLVSFCGQLTILGGGKGVNVQVVISSDLFFVIHGLSSCVLNGRGILFFACWNISIHSSSTLMASSTIDHYCLCSFSDGI